MKTNNILPPDSTPITKLLPPYPTSSKAKLFSTVAQLHATIWELIANDCGAEILLLLDAIALSTFLSEECYQRFIDTGMQAA